ncbi:MAG: methylenetetrahydrofolate reductase C-terminal domain-containing protein [Deltaproteobacteria bacterium]|nr:methylenetetrahydrofolate reductase C-terminal domain-containing protein [Deltaproteobacteria bacterium]
MIVADRKDINEILDMIKDCKKVLIAGCKGCVTVCNVGGAKEVGILASIIKIARKKDGLPIEVDEVTLERQCDPEYLEKIKETVGTYDAVLSMACGVGPQFLSEAYPDQRFFPAVNTTFFGGAVQHGIWEERCAGCGNCIIHYFDGICPIARCSKSLLNGPCGGSSNGKCEISKEVDCVWDMIVKKKMKQGRIEDLLAFMPAKDWRTARDGGPRKSVREELVNG